MTTVTYFFGSLIGGCVGVALVAMIWGRPIRKHLLSNFCMALGIAIGFAFSRHLFLGTRYALPFMCVIGSLGAATGIFVGRLLEHRMSGGNQ